MLSKRVSQWTSSLFPRQYFRYYNDHSCISTAVLFLSSLSSQVLPRVPRRYKHLHQRISMDNTRSFTAELSGITTSIGECRGDTIAFVRISQWTTSLYYTPGTQILPRVSKRYNHLASCLSMDNIVLFAMGVSDTTTIGREMQPSSFTHLNGSIQSFNIESR
jgi:hypothetical protein